MHAPRAISRAAASTTLSLASASAPSAAQLHAVGGGLMASLSLGFFRRAVAWRPHPKKIATGGEDAYLATDYVLGVADGVGFWGDRGVNAGAYSEGLMRSAHDYCVTEFQGQNCVPCIDLLRAAYEDNKSVTGTSTALLTSLCNENLEIAALGDCHALVLRDGQLVFRSEEQVHSLNFPFQLGTGSADTPEDADRAVVAVQPGDIILLGTDGVFDNLYDRDIVAALQRHIAFGEREATVGTYFQADGRKKEERLRFRDAATPSLIRAVNQLVNDAVLNAYDPRVPTPFSDKCVEAGAYYEGGKDDDMTLVIACVGPDLNEVSGERFAHRDDDVEMIFPPYKNWP